ncbi:hypothetical protein CCZ01_04260 [Helicobacter monodelphidis]|uniref:hypothetical protein n=1 Tax=Helicobacter sp. 15-1451 TaxID=2004995 RepID=UPI000DCE03A7|nr:hypothetical protein [Helicobacter sp. 15-1451]RAX58027.1 hypothetical protein CCZ01_04260 [Helicobacter sp. 15-1451]
MLINTGQKRSVVGHAVSGGLISFMVSGALNYSKLRSGEITQQEALRQVAKNTLQGAAVTAAAIAATNVIGDNQSSPIKNSLEAFGFIVAGGLAAYGLNQFLDSEQNTLLLESKEEE